MEARHLITAGIALLLVACVRGSGYLEVHLHSLANPHGRKSSGSACDWHQGGCDHQFDFCLTTQNDDATCHYGKKSTSTYENTYAITFGSTINGGLSNPFTFAFPTSYPGAFRLIISVKDDDHPFTDDTIDRIVIQRSMSPGDTERSNFSGQYIGDFRMDITVTVRCNPNFYGSRCSIACAPRNDSKGHYTCNSDGQKVCNEGWIDPFYSCTTPVCDAPCVQGTCVGPNICSCNSGYTGSRCNQAICRSGCSNGGCTVPDECICLGGYSGNTCEIDERFCERQNPCTNGGRCVDTGPNLYECICPHGFNGSICQSTYDVCSVPDFCSNGGACQTMGQGQFTCTCPRGYTGQTCGDLVNNCVGQPCENGGTCINALNSFSCVCTPGYSGDTCSTDLDLCASSPCQNGGTCIDYGDDYYCQCPPNILASPPRNCSGQPCEYHPCNNGGNCSNLNGIPMCTCTSEWIGDYCELNASVAIQEEVATGLDADDEALPFNVIIGIGLGGGVGVLTLLLCCVAIAICIVGVCCCRQDKGADYEITCDVDEEREIAEKVKTIDSVVANPQYISLEERHIYDEVGRGQNPYEEVHLGHQPSQYNKLGGQQYSNPTPPPPSIPSLPNPRSKDQYDVPKNNSLSSSASPSSFTLMADARV